MTESPNGHDDSADETAATAAPATAAEHCERGERIDETDEAESTHPPRSYLLGATSAGFGTVALGLLVMSPLLPAIIDDLSITPFQAGAGLSIMWGLNALGQYLGGRVSDVLGRHPVLVFGLLGLVAGVLVVTVSATFLGYLVGVAFLGLFSGTYPATGFTHLSELYAGEQGKAFGIYTSFWDIGGGLSAGLATVALATGNWRLAFPPIIVLAVAVALVLHSWRDEPYNIERVQFDFRATVSRALVGPEQKLLVLSFCLFMLTWQGAVSFLPTFLQVEKGLPAGIAASAFASLFVIGMLVKPVSGNLGDRFGRLRAALCSVAIGTVGLLALSIVQSTAWILVGVAIFAVGLMSFTPPMLAYVMARLPDANAGGDIGGFRTVYMGVGSVGPAYVGLLADVATYGVAFAGLMLALLASAATILVAFRY
ncbi:major facilitator superfamily protein [Natrialba hulunbeirensis JCM 10989]|uniref:Major facilitator superfamily protein n=1 Tax=Natrialba hulunbeirensis JCM 10989 TaxID=1227493 RepID=M0A3V5_9EURY|nr:MFS transporter [Natrialba hulunbeirensis]ELY93440.1 major facilitator superfamily protein [Natrialba hulunbeirensis JCM 10989]